MRVSEVRNLLTKGSAEFASAYYIDDFPGRPALSGKLMLPAAKPVTLLILWSNLDQVMVEEDHFMVELTPILFRHFFSSSLSFVSLIDT